MKNKRTYYHLILDRSGSMSSCVEQTVEGVNRQIIRIKEVAERFPEQEIFTSLTIFNQEVSRVWDMLPPEKLREITFSDYQPAGMTALLDATGMTIREMQKKIGEELENDLATAVIVIITDGHENSSVNFTHRQVSSMIRELEAGGKWTFSYLGATLDAVEIAVSLNIKRSNSMRFDMNETQHVYSYLNKSLDNYISEKENGKIRQNFLGNDEPEEDNHDEDR